MAIDVPASAIRDAQGAAGELWAVVLALAGPESNYNPRAVGDNGCSYGYTQFNTCGGLGDGHSPSELMDGPTNFRLAAEYIRGKLASGASLYDALQPWSTRDAALGLLSRFQTEGISGIGPVSSQDMTGASVSGGGIVLLAVGILALALVQGHRG